MPIHAENTTLKTSAPIHVETTIDDVTEQFRLAWASIDSKDIDTAWKLVNDNAASAKGSHRLYWLVVKSAIHLHEKDYLRTIKTIVRFRNKLEKKYYFLKDNPGIESETGKNVVAWNYKKTLTVSSKANHKMEYWMRALIDCLELTKEFGETNYFQKAECYHRLKNYPEALVNYRFEYDTSYSDTRRDEAAYYVAATYALLEKVDQSIAWLAVPLESNIRVYGQKMIFDTDFDGIRHGPKFTDFLKSRRIPTQ